MVRYVLNLIHGMQIDMEGRWEDGKETMSWLIQPQLSKKMSPSDINFN